MPDLERATPLEETRRQHEVAVCPPPGEYAGNEDRWELDCDVCGYIGSGATETEAWEMAARHSVGPALPAATSTVGEFLRGSCRRLQFPGRRALRPRGF